MSLFNDRIPVLSSGDGVTTIGYISGESGMIVNNQNWLLDLELTAMSEGLCTLTGNAAQTYYQYNHLVNIKEVNATGTPYFYPTGAGSYPFGAA